MKEVTRDEFERLYFELGGGQTAGWTRDYWERQFAAHYEPPMKFLAEPPETPEHTRMFIVSDFKAREHRMIFLTEEAEERFFDYPGKE